MCVNRGKRSAHPEGATDLDLITASKHALQAWSLGVEDGERRLHLRSEARRERQANWLVDIRCESDRKKGVATTPAPSRGRSIARWDAKRR